MSAHNGDPREHVRAWIDFERRTYADEKFAPDADTTQALVRDVQDNPKMQEGRAGAIDIDLFVGNYLQRVRLFGLDTPAGRQAIGKLIVTLTDHLERAVITHGPMPRPGVSSGNIHLWEGDTHA